MKDGKIPKTNGKRNKSAGKKWEHDTIRTLKERGLYPNACSTRSESRTLDGCGIDVMNRNEGAVGIMQDSIQCKTESRMVPYAKLLDRIRSANRPNPVIFHRQTSRSGTRFMERDTFAICYLDSYLELLACRMMVACLKEQLCNIPEPVRTTLTEQLKKLGLF